jgi:sugar transferase (PEP-CTERM/EpsH1 system associated)
MKSSLISVAKKIRIAHLIYSFEIGGLEKGIATVVKNASPQFEHVILCLTTSGKSESLLPTNTQVVELHKPPGNSPLFLLKLTRVLKSLGPDIVHTRNWSGMDGIIAARVVGIRAVVHGEHGWGMDDPEGLLLKRVLIRRFLAHWVSEYTCVSKQIANWLCNDVRVRKPVTQIYNGVDVEKYRPGNSGTRIRAELGITAHVPLIGVVGRLDPIKDHPTLFRAFEIVRTVLPEARLLVVGDGPERKRLENQAGDGVIFLGNRSDVPEILRAFDLFVLPSLNEGISNTILEAMATGIPVVVTRVGGNPEIVEDERTGVLVKPGDFQSMASAIVRYLQHPDLRAKHGEAGRQSVLKRFSIEAMVRSYEAVYQRLDRRHSI